MVVLNANDYSCSQQRRVIATFESCMIPSVSRLAPFMLLSFFTGQGRPAPRAISLVQHPGWKDARSDILSCTPVDLPHLKPTMDFHEV